MLNFLPGPVLGVIASLLLACNALFWVPILMTLALIKLLLPVQRVRVLLDPWLVRIAEAWIWGNSSWMRLTQRTVWDVQGAQDLQRRSWYLVNCNHQSWVDILVLQHIFNRRIPMLKFFIKRELIWVPVMGLAWWALDFPFMRRHSEEYLRQHPEQRGRDQATTRRACEKFALIPTSVMNFLEGTRFTPAKQARQQSPYQHLLKPKVGGMAVAMQAMGERFQAILDVTIVYPDRAPAFWHFLCGKLKRVVVRVRTLPVPQALVQGDYAADANVRGAYQQWGQQLWAEKDQLIAQLLEAAGTPRLSAPASPQG